MSKHLQKLYKVLAIPIILGLVVGSLGLLPQEARATSVPYDNSIFGNFNGNASVSINLTVGSNANRVLVCGIVVGLTGGDVVNAPLTDNGTAMTRLTAFNGFNNPTLYYYWIANPPSGSNTIATTLSDPFRNLWILCASYYNTSQTQPSNIVTATSTSNPSVFNLTTTTNNAWVTGVILIGTGDNGTASSGVFRQQDTGRGLMDTNTTITPAGTGTLATSIDGSQTWAVLVELDPASGGGGGSTPKPQLIQFGLIDKRKAI
jgi:hypothetical protein